MATKTEQLNKLFQKWETEIPEYQGHFVRDGIIIEDQYQTTNPKILFITKEPNNPKQEAGDFREWWEKKLKFTFSLRIADWAYGILNDFPEYDEIKNSREEKLIALHKVAFMNVKKSGGGGTAKHGELIRHIGMNLKYIQDEIRIIEPEIIILGLSTREIRGEVFPELKGKWKDSGYDIAIAKYNNAKVIDFYHPSARNAAAASYSLLENVIGSPAFENL